MIRYKLYQNNNENSSTYKKWYARSVCEVTYDTQKLAQHMAEHNSPYSEGVIKGILTDMINCIKELILDGKNVKLDDLAIFSVGMKTKPAASAKTWSAANNLKGFTLRARATGKLNTSNLKKEAQVREYSTYDVEE